MALTQVRSDGIATGAVTATQIATGAVTANDLEDSGVTAGTYGSSSAIPAITVDAKGRITSASTSSIDSTAITNGTSNVSVAASGDITATRAGTQRLAVTSNGIDVTGRVTCDGVTSDGSINLESSTGVVNLKDTNNTGGAAQCEINFKDSGNGTLGYLGYANTSDNDFYIVNSLSGSIQFNTNGQNRFEINNSGHVLPNTSGALDLGSSTNQWRNGWFDGTVNCDGLVCVGDATVTSSTGRLYIQDNDNTGSNTDCSIIGRDSAGTQKWYYGTGSGTDSVYLWNYANDLIQFGTNNTHRISLTGSGHLVPNGGNTYDLGDSTNRWRNVYTNDLNLSNEGGSNDVDGTWGSWTIQEGEDDLFLLNRRNGKKYKFNLSEVN